ncbi:MAG: carboxypeptidase-like regulatory domain-containing protein [Bacteroidota bacterium]
MIKFTLISLFTYLALSVTAQEYNLSGVLKDSANNDPLIGATIILSNEKDTTSKKLTTSNLEGLFTFNNLVNGDYLLKIRYIGYQTITVKQQINGRNIDLGIIILNPSQDMLDAVEVEGKVLPVVQKGDTTQFNANAFKTNPDATTEDLVRKMPGVVVENGTVKAQGEDVQQVLVDGKPFLEMIPH